MKQSKLSNYKIIITGGPTREWIDPVRFISNPSSGKMGAALANAAKDYSDDIVFICGPICNCIKKSVSCSIIPVETTEQMKIEVMSLLRNNSILIMAAAPCDYLSENVSDKKLKKTPHPMSLSLKPAVDILKEVKAVKTSFQNFITIGFSAETNDSEKYAKEKLYEKDLDAICLNDITKRGVGFGHDTNELTIFLKNGGQVNLELMDKQSAAREILIAIENNILL